MVVVAVGYVLGSILTSLISVLTGTEDTKKQRKSFNPGC